MTIEASTTFGWQFAGIVGKLKRHPADVQQLTRFRQAIDDILALGMQIISAQPHHVAAAAQISQQQGLLSNDALIVALMQQQRIAQLASNDADFDRVPSIVRFAPL